MSVRRRLAVRLLPALVLVLLLVPVTLALSRTAPAGRALLPDLDQETPTGLVVTRGPHGDWRLGFTSAVRNVGRGPLVIVGGRVDRFQKTMHVDQAVTRDGSPKQLVRGVGRLRYVVSPDHRHWHYLRFDRYDLRRPSGDVVVRDRKSGFCLGDRYFAQTAVAGRRPTAPVHTSRCGLGKPGLLGVREGISVGYGDDYAANLEGQYLSLDGLAAGDYVLVHRVNADRRLRESDYGNDAASLRLGLSWSGGEPRIRVLGVCPDSATCTPALPARHPPDVDSDTGGSHARLPHRPGRAGGPR